MNGQKTIYYLIVALMVISILFGIKNIFQPF